MLRPPPRSPLFPYTTLFRSPNAPVPIERALLEANMGGDKKPSYEFFQSGHGKTDRKSTRLNSSHVETSYAVFCLKKKKSPAIAGLPDSPARGGLRCRRRARR